MDELSMFKNLESESGSNIRGLDGLMCNTIWSEFFAS